MSDAKAIGVAVDATARPADDRTQIFARFVEERLAEQYRLAAVILGDRVEAQDAVHDAVERAWRRFPTLADVDRFDAWVGRILVNECRDRLRRRTRRRVVDISDQVIDLLEAPDALSTSIDRDAIGRAFAVLNPDQRIAVSLRYFADLSVDQIAERTSVPAGTVKSRLHHAIAALHKALARTDRGGWM